MAYGDKYIGRFWTHPTRDLCTIKIQEDGYSGSVDTLILAEDALFISAPVKRNLAGAVMGMGCQIRVINTGNLTKYDDLFGNAERFHKVIITLKETNPVTLFEGFIQPMVHRQALQRKSRFTISADNQLSGLNEYYSNLLESDYAFSRITLQELIKDILDSTGIDAPIYIKNTLFSTLYSSAFDLNITCFDKLKINRQVFIEQDELMDGRSILEKILQATYSRLYYFNGKWVIDRMRDVHSTDMYKVYPFTGTAFTEELLHDSFELSNEHILEGGGSLEYEPGKKKYKMIINFDKYDNLVPSNFIHIQQSALISTTTKGRLPYPTLGFWQTWNALEVFNKSLMTNYINSGISHTNGSLTAAEYYYALVSATFITDFQSNHSISISYGYDWSQIGAVSNRSYRGGFRIRYKDSTENWRFLTFVDGQLKLNSKFSDDVSKIDFSNLDEVDWELQWGPYRVVSGSVRYIWRIQKLTTTLWESNSEWVSASPVYGDILFNSETTSAQFTATINDESVDEYSRIPARPEWSTDHADADERVGGIYKYYGSSGAGYREFEMISLTSLYKITGAEAQDNPLQEINEEINFEDIEAWVINDLGVTPEIFELVIDLMPMHRINHPEEDNVWEPTLNNRTYMGDVVISQNNEISNNVIEGVINKDFRDTLEYELKIYDGVYVNYKNTMQIFTGGKYVKSKDWLDVHSGRGDVAQKIHYVLIRDLAQQYNLPRHLIKVDLILSETTSINRFVSPGSVFTFTELPGKQFIILGYDYNVKMMAWRISLVEHKDYDNFEITT